MKKWFAFAILVLAAVFFVSCGDSKKDDNKDNPDTTDTDTENPDSATDTQPDTTDPDTTPEPADDSDTTDDSDNPDTTDDSDTASGDCEILEFGTVYYMNSSSGDYYEAYAEHGMAGDKAYTDVLQIDFRNKKELETGTFTLSNDRKTCEHCVFLGEDFDKEKQGSPTKRYFQESGELVFEEVQEGNLRSRGHGSFRLVEVNLSGNPVENGKCYDVKNLEWDTICRPDCEGKICGDDGCGKTCGEGCGELACNATQTECVPYNCQTLDLNILSLSYYLNYGIPTYQSQYSTNTGGDYNIFYMEIVDKANAVGEHILDENSVSGNAGITLSLWEIDDITDADSTKFYFPKKGSVTIYEYDYDSTYISFSTEDIMVEEVNMYRDDQGARYTIPVAGGKCYDIVDFEYNDQGY